MMNAYMRKYICKRYVDSSWTSWTEPRKYLNTRHLQLWNHVQEGFVGLVLLDTGMTPMVWWSVIISQADLAPLYRRSRIPQGGELQEVAVVSKMETTASDGKPVPKWNKLRFSINPYTIGVGNHGGKDILIINEAGLHLRSGCLIM